MGAKKKGLANRLAKMSDEERARYIQHRADMEEEVRRRKEQLISTFLKNKMKKEDEFSRLNIAKINENWHQILRRFKCQELKENVQHLKCYFERVLDLKNKHICKLMVELQEAEDQYSNNYQCHLTHIDGMIEFHTRNLNELNNTYEADRLCAIELAHKERQVCLEKAEEDLEYLKIVFHGQEMISSKQLRENYDYYKAKTDDVVRENKREFEEMRRTKEKAIGELWRQLSSLLRTYVADTDKKRAHLAELHSLDAESATEIAKNEEHIYNQEVDIKYLKELQTNKVTAGNKLIEELKDSLKQTTKQHLKVKIKLHRELKLDARQIRFLTNVSKETINYLNTWLDKGHKVLILANVCRKYETPREQLLKWATEETDAEISESVGEKSSHSDNYDASNEENGVDVGTTTEIVRTSTKKKVLRPKSSFPLKKHSPRLRKLQSAPIHKTRTFTSLSKSISSNSSTPKTFISTSSSSSSSIKPRKLQPIIKKCTIIEDTCDSLKDVEGLWSVYNKVVLNYMEMRYEKKRLIEENSQMQGMIRSILVSDAMERNNTVENNVASGIGIRRVIQSAPPLQYLI